MPHRPGAAPFLAIGALILAVIVASTGCSYLPLGASGPTAEPTATRRPPPAVIPTWTPVPSPTPPPTETPVPVAVSDCRLGAAFVSDVTIPDRTAIQAGQRFVKTWALRNTGTCPWGEGYYLAFAGQQRMGAPDRVPVPETAPGATAEVSVELVAPETPGSYRSDWQMYAGGDPGRSFGAVVYTLIVVE